MVDFWLNHQGTVNLYTERLVLRKFSIADASDMYINWASDKDVAKHTLWIVNESISETKSFLEDWQLRYSSKQYYHWAIVSKENKQAIGSISISGLSNYTKSCYIGYTLSKKYWNMGIATEATKCVIDFMVRSIGVQKIYAYHDVENCASGRVMQKCGMKYVKTKKKIVLNTTKTLIDCDLYCFYAKQEIDK